MSGSDYGCVEGVDKEWPVPSFATDRQPTVLCEEAVNFANSTHTFVAEVSEMWLCDMGVGHIHSSLSFSLDEQ